MSDQNTGFSKSERFYPYKMQPVQELVEKDFYLRILFWEEILVKCETVHNFSSIDVFNDEATVTVRGSVNKLNIRYLVLRKSKMDKRAPVSSGLNS